MAEEHDDRIEALFHQAADLHPDERQALLDAACESDPELRAAVERLLAKDARLGAAEGSGFLESPLIRTPAVLPAGATLSQETGKPPLPSHVGRYRLIRLLGEGGMGTVYEAEQDSPRRTVALKVVRPGLATPGLLKRFHNESQLLGRLSHPGIAQVYEAGLAADGQPFFAMEFIRGLPLDEYARLRAPTLPERLDLLARVCDAVQHAHDQGVIHRDLKPANILVEETGQPKVLDFGVARAIDADLLTEAGLTRTGQVLGTPSYMSPEQVTADHFAIDHRADVYALGVILFELAAHRLPYRLEGRPLVEATRLILEEDPPRLGSINPELRGDVETIVTKALEKDPARRYASAGDLAADLRHWLHHEPILARPPSALYHLRKFARRNRGLVGGVLATGVALVVGLVGTTLFALAESRQRGQAEQNAREAEENTRLANHEKREAQYQTYQACMAAAGAALQNHDVAAAASHLKLAPEELRGWEWRHLNSRLDDSSAVVPLTNEDEKSFLFPGTDRLRAGVVTSAGVRITDLEGGEHRTMPLGPEYTPVRCTATHTRLGVRVVAWAGDTAFDLLDENGRVLCRCRPTVAGIINVFVSPDARRMVVPTWRKRERIELFDAISGQQTATCAGHEGAIWSYCFSPDSSRLATAGEDKTARVWDAATGELLATCKGHTSKVHSAAFSPDGTRLVTTSADATVRQWDWRKGGEVEPPYDRHSSEVLCAAYSPDGRFVASAGLDRDVRVWRAKGQQDVTLLHGHKGAVSQLAFSLDGRRLASLSQPSVLVYAGDGTVRIWDVGPRATLPVLHGHTSYVYPVAYSPDGRWLASGSWDNTVRLWDAATGEASATLPHDSSVFGLAFGPDGSWLLTGDRRPARLRVWDVATARVRKVIPWIGNPVLESLTVSPDGTRVAATAVDELFKNPRLTVYDIASGEPLCSADGTALAYSPDGRWLAALAVDDKTILLLNAQTLGTVAEFSGHEKHVEKVAFSPDSRLLASCGQDRTVRLWQIGSSECRVLSGHTDHVYAVAFHPDGTRLASAAQDGAVWLWDLARGDGVARLPGHKNYVWSLAFSKDGATLASGSGDGTVRLWDTVPLTARYQARREAAALRLEAEQLVEQLWREKNDPDKVVEALRADHALSESLRHAALCAVLRRMAPPEAAPSNPLDPP